MTTSTARDGFSICTEDGVEIDFIPSSANGARREKAFMGLLRKSRTDLLILDTRDETGDV